ncbi:response regulator [Fulvivirga sp. RKSG066]|uniref:response regulator n=1 Tax=Fulvivirga aurantia TaxID=2529383 RepID=UPI0012BCED93|nr:response regulator [Fulvivirga aurantia]MTI22952.1 response regulator [Fulvivirga aurantia]
MEGDQEISILYVDDEKVNLFIFEANFRSKFNIITALSGEEALNKLAQNNSGISIVISDMMMPIMNGLNLIERAKSQFQNIHYYILTGLEHSEELDQAVEQQIVRKVFHKPLDKEAILLEIKQVLAGDQGSN